jgi:hypothetical protein
MAAFQMSDLERDLDDALVPATGKAQRAQEAYLRADQEVKSLELFITALHARSGIFTE